MGPLLIDQSVGPRTLSLGCITIAQLLFVIVYANIKLSSAIRIIYRSGELRPLLRQDFVFIASESILPARSLALPLWRPPLPVARRATFPWNRTVSCDLSEAIEVLPFREGQALPVSLLRTPPSESGLCCLNSNGPARDGFVCNLINPPSKPLNKPTHMRLHKQVVSSRRQSA